MDLHFWGHGFILQQQSNQLTMTNSKWTLSTDINISHYYAVMARVHTYLRDYDTLAYALMTKNTTLLDRDIITRVTYENTVLHAKTKHISKRLAVLQSLISNHERNWGTRHKRMVVAPVMGTVLKFLFGTADNNDVIEIHKRIGLLGTAVQKIHHLNELQATLLQTLHNDNAAQDAMLVKLTTATNGLLADLTQMKFDYGQAERQHDLERRTLFAFLTNIEMIRDTIDRAANIVQDLLVDVSTIATGKIPSHLLPPDLLMEGLQAVSKVLPHGHSLLSPTSTGILWDYYHLTIVRSLVLDDGLRLFIDLPIIVPRSSFDLFHIIPFPTPIPGTLNFTVLDITSPFVALSSDHDYFVPLTPADVDSCHRTPLPLCIRQFPIWTTLGSTSCELAVSLKDDAGIAANCQMSLLKTSSPKFLFLYDTSWAYFFPQLTTLRFNCIGGSNPSPMSLIGSGTIVVPHHCAVQSKQFFIRAGVRGNSSVSSKIPTITPPSLQSLPLPSALSVFQNATHLVDIRSSSDKDWLISFSELTSSLQTKTPIFESLNDRFDFFSSENSFETRATSAVSSFVFLLLLGVFSFLIFLGRRRICRSPDAPPDLALRTQLTQLENDLSTLRAFTISELEFAKTLILHRSANV